MKALKKIINKNFFLKLFISVTFATINAFLLYGEFDNISVFIVWCSSIIIWYILTGLSIRFFPIASDYICNKSKRIDEVIEKYFSGWKLFFLIWAIIIIAWIIPFLALYPGTIGYDSPLELAYWNGSVKMTDHHPVSHTVFLGVIYDIGCYFWGEPNGGVVLFSIIQGLIVSSSIAYCLYVIKNKGASSIFVIVSLLWGVFNPYVQSLTFNSTKDILFAAFFLYFITMFYCYIVEKDKSIIRLVLLFATGLLMCLLRHQGVYILFLLLVFVIFTPKRTNIKKIRTIIVITCILLIVEMFNYVVHNVLKYEPGDTREMLSVPMQQMAYVCNLKINGEQVNITDEQFDDVEKIIPEDGIRAYEAYCADNVKSKFNTDVFKANLGGNIKTYLQIGINNKGRYLYAFKNLISGYLEPKDRKYNDLIYAYPFSGLGHIIHREPIAEWYYDILVDNTSEGLYEKIPLLSILYDVGLSIYLLILLVGLCIYRKDYRLWLIILPMLLFLLSLFLGPAALIRYIYPLIILTPFLVFHIIRKAT